MLFPLFWMVKGSFESIFDIMKIPPKLIPAKLILENYQILWKGTSIIRWTGNTLIVASAAIAFNLFCTVLSSYAFSMYQFRGKQFIYWMFIASIMIPSQSLIISRFVLMARMNLIDNWLSLILVSGCSPIAIVFFRNYFNKVPRDFADSARIDGLGEFGILFKVMLPQCRAIIGYLCIVGYMASFQAFLWPFLMIMDSKKKTLALGVIYFLQTYYTQEGMTMGIRLGLQLAGGVILFVPVIIIFLAFHKMFRQEFIAGGIKQ